MIELYIKIISPSFKGTKRRDFLLLDDPERYIEISSLETESQGRVMQYLCANGILTNIFNDERIDPQEFTAVEIPKAEFDLAVERAKEITQ